MLFELNLPSDNQSDPLLQLKSDSTYLVPGIKVGPFSPFEYPILISTTEFDPAGPGTTIPVSEWLA